MAKSMGGFEAREGQRSWDVARRRERHTDEVGETWRPDHTESWASL